MSGKAKINEQVWYKYLADCLVAANKSELDGKTNGIPRLSASATNCEALQMVTSAIDDTGVRMHGLSYTPGMFGETLVDAVLAPVRRFFQEYPHGETYVMRMDIGIFMPEPKRATQLDHTRGIVTTMERKNIAPIDWRIGEPVPLMIGFGAPLPEWTAVRANRTLFRHACNQLMELIQATYRPPRGCRLVLDYNVPNTSSGVGSLDDWMTGERIKCSPLAARVIESARARFQRAEQAGDSWHVDADRLVTSLARAGHIKVAPLCLETDLFTNVTYAPFVLHNAAHNCGEADVGCLFWVDALQSDKLHRTLAGVRLPIFSGGDDAAVAPAPPLQTVAERRAFGMRLLDNEPDTILLVNDPSAIESRYLTYVAQPEVAPHQTPPRSACGAALVISVDTDFFALVLLWYAHFCHEQLAGGGDDAAERSEYCRVHAPFLSLGQLYTKRAGRLAGADDIVSTEAFAKLQPADAVGVERRFAVWDMASVYARVCALTAHGSELERAASFAMFCAVCQNDYLPSFYGVNRCHSYQALLATDMRLVRYDAGKPIVDLANVIEFVKHTYYLSMKGKGGKAPPVAPRHASYAQMARFVADKYKKKEAHMPSAEALQQRYMRCQWWISMATEAWRDLGGILDHRIWGWSELT